MDLESRCRRGGEAGGASNIQTFVRQFKRGPGRLRCANRGCVLKLDPDCVCVSGFAFFVCMFSPPTRKIHVFLFAVVVSRRFASAGRAGAPHSFGSAVFVRSPVSTKHFRSGCIENIMRFNVLGCFHGGVLVGLCGFCWRLRVLPFLVRGTGCCRFFLAASFFCVF